MSNESRPTLERHRVPVGIRLALLWTSLMFLYIYNDYFDLYSPGTIEQMAAGRIGPLGPATDAVLVGVAIVMAIPALMIFLSAALPPIASRWLNVVFGLAYTGIEALTFIGSRPFYQLIVALEIALSALIVWTALRWPRQG
jgi:hypothetical protein